MDLTLECIRRYYRHEYSPLTFSARLMWLYARAVSLSGLVLVSASGARRRGAPLPASGICRERTSGKLPRPWPLRCPQAALVPAAVAVTEARQRPGQVLGQAAETIQRAGAVARVGTGFSQPGQVVGVA